ncbi:MAG: type II restriction endonuclease [bacterium]|nr:type II restriction endonuclease [bacterium]
MDAEAFRAQLLPYLDQFQERLATAQGDWVVKGFIDLHQNIYTVSVDTKVISKVVELMLFPAIAQFAAEHGYQVILSAQQNHYPDVTFITPDQTKIALDLKSTYRVTPTLISGFTLGAFTGYFRQRKSNKNITFPYEQYSAHFVLGTIYSRNEGALSEQHIYALDDLPSITSVIRDFTFLLQEKWRIASTRPGSGNTKNIGSILNIDALVQGEGPFVPHGETVFNDYWMNYLTADMARAIDSEVVYRNLTDYFRWRSR